MWPPTSSRHRRAWADLSKFKQATDSNMSLVSAGTTAPTRTLLSVPVLVSNSMTDGTMLVLDKSTILSVYGSVQLATSTVYYFGSDHATAGGNRPRSAIACGRCDRWWTGRNEAHCSACHETFTCIGAFDWHRRNGQCRKPPDVGLVVADRGVVRLESARHLERP